MGLLGVPEGDRGLPPDWTRRVVGYQGPDEAGVPVPDGSGRAVNPCSPALLRDMFDHAGQRPRDGPQGCPGAHVARLRSRPPYAEVLRALPEPPVLARPAARLVPHFVGGVTSLPARVA